LKQLCQVQSIGSSSFCSETFHVSNED
jgi:hypothetical protein